MNDHDPDDKDPALRKTLVFGWYLLAISVPAGMTLEALHALKVEVYLGSALRRELWTLAHAHANLLGLLCLAFASLGERWLQAPSRAAISRWLRCGSALMPLGFFGGGILNHEGDPSLAIVLVPLGGVCLLVALLRAARGVRRSEA